MRVVIEGEAGIGNAYSHKGCGDGEVGTFFPSVFRGSPKSRFPLDLALSS